MRVFSVIKYSKSHRDTDPVVCTEARAFGINKTVLCSHIKRILCHIERTVFCLNTDHILMSLQDNGTLGKILRSDSRRLNQNISFFVPDIFKFSVLRKPYEIVSDSGTITRSVRY